ncbi:MAG: polysaccharide biosynthesis/export family protein [Thermoguttaceae bacterium]|jgi:polysaccharide export outer membrane protein
MLAHAFVRRAGFLVVLIAGVGCAGAGFAADDEAEGRSKKAGAEIPRELAMRHLPTYRIEPPDILQIEMLKMVPLPPYHIEVYDVLKIGVVGALADQPINDFYLVEGGGIVSLGPAYGNVRVGGMTIDEATKAITSRLQEILHDPKVSVQLTRTAATQPVTGQYLVGPDGTINLRQYGTVLVMGSTLTEAKAALEKLLAKYFESPQVTVDVLGYNSKVYYIITDGAGMGDNVRRIPISGNETVLDAVARVGGLSQFSSKKMWIARPSPSDSEKGTILPIDYYAITQRGATKTNYQIMPGDRIFIAGDSAIALSNKVNKITQPVERIMGLISLGAATIDSVEKIWPQQEEP